MLLDILIPVFTLNSYLNETVIPTLLYPLIYVLNELDNTIAQLFYYGWAGFFYQLMPVVALVCAVLVPTLSNPVHSLLTLIGCFFAVAVLLIANGAEFLGYLFLIVYIGAIAILFLFVIMLLNVNQLTEQKPTSVREYFSLPYLLSFFIVGSVSSKFLLDLYTALATATTFETKTFGYENINFVSELETLVNSSIFDIYPFATLLYTEQSALLVVDSLLLLSAMLGAIVLAVNSTEYES